MAMEFTVTLLWSHHMLSSEGGHIFLKSSIKRASSEMQILCLHPFRHYSRKHEGRHANVLVIILLSELQIYSWSSMHMQTHI